MPIGIHISNFRLKEKKKRKENNVRRHVCKYNRSNKYENAVNKKQNYEKLKTL